MTSGPRTFGTPIPIPAWWLREAKRLLDESEDWNQVSLAAELTRIVGRKPAYDHKAVQRFLKGETTTIEMMDAFLDVFPSLLPPVFFAHSSEEAARLSNAARRIRSTPEWKRRYRSLESQMHELGDPVRDHTETLPSENEAKPRRRKKDSGRIGRLG